MATWTDVNAVVSGLLGDLAAVQTARQKTLAYRRAAAIVLALEEPIGDLLRSKGSLKTIAGIGPSSSRVIHEVLETGGSPTVERAVAGSGRSADVIERRETSGYFLSRAAVVRVLADDAVAGIGVSDYCGDLQMHSEWSDGAPTLGEIVEGCLARAYQYAAVTDHSHGLAIANGMSMASAAEQHQAIDQLNRAYAGRFTLIKGIEANIGADGRLDLTDQDASRFDLVLAAPHSNLRLADDQTTRLVTAIRQPQVRILAHPSGRHAGTRAGIVANWDTVFAAAEAAGVAIEIDGDPARQDVDFELAARALEAGCLFALDSDAHTIGQLRYVETAIAHARIAGIPPARVVNCWGVEKLGRWLAKDKRAPEPASSRPRSPGTSRRRRR